MPDPFDFDEARRALDEVPAPDLWAEAERRAADDAVVPLDGALGRSRHPGRWLAVAAAAALAVGTLAVLVDDDDQTVDTDPRDTTPITDEPPGMVDGPAPTSGAAYAIWPITAPGHATDFGDLVVARETTEAAALSFAQTYLGWRDAVVTDREPSEDGRNGGVYLVSSAALGGEVVVWAAPGDGDDGNVVYRVDSPGREIDPNATASVSVAGDTATAIVAPAPEGTVSTSVLFSYGSYVSEGAAGTPITLARDLGTPGAVLVLFRDATGNPIGAWGRALPAGDFAAG